MKPGCMQHAHSGSRLQPPRIGTLGELVAQSRQPGLSTQTCLRKTSNAESAKNMSELKYAEMSWSRGRYTKPQETAWGCAVPARGLRVSTTTKLRALHVQQHSAVGV